MKSFALFVISLFLTASLFAQRASDCLVAYYPFNGTCHDTTGNGHDATKFGTFYDSDRHGAPNSAIGFDGVDDYLRVEHHTDFDFTKSMSISIWIKQTAIGWKGYRLVDHHTAGTGNGWNYDIYYTQSGDNRKQSFIGNQRVYATTFHNINEWVHLAVTYADGVAKFYLNGQFDNQVTLTGNELNVNTLPVLIGASQGTISGNEYYEGLMDELKIFNCTLTEAQILEIYTTGIEDVARKDALPFFNFDPATGNVIIGSDISIGGVQIWNASGALVYKGVSPKINIADLPEGIFVIQVIEKKTGEIYTSKLLK